MRRWIWLVAAAALLAPAVQAGMAQTNELTIVARDSGSADACPEGKTFCFVVTEGELDDIAPGDEVTIHFENNGSIPHEIAAARLQDADAQHQATSEDDAFARSDENMAPGTNDTVAFTVPTDAEGLYLWCDVAGHEQVGMWLETEFEDTQDGDDDENGTPMPVWITLLSVTLAFLGRRAAGGRL